jgi:predicted thioesterase
MIVPGLTGEVEITVETADTAHALGNAGLHVLATPRLVALLEQAAIRAVAPHLPAGVGTVGTHLDVRHLAATPVGFRVRVRAVLREVDGRRLVYDVEGHDDTDRICAGTHERVQIEQARFLGRVETKARHRA